jgi:glycosyltransferase involved in cell wall biosynthesis
MALALHTRGYAVTVACAPEGELAQHLRQRVPELPQVHFRIKNLSFLNPFLRQKIKRFFREKGITHVIFNLPSDLKTAAPAAKSAGVFRIIYRRGSAIPVKNTLLNRYLFRQVLTDVIANSEATKQTVLVHGVVEAAKIKVLYNGLDTKAFEEDIKPLIPKKEGVFTLGSAGRFSPEKGHDLLLEAFALLKEKNYPIQLLFAGKGELESELKTQADSLGVKGDVLFLGFQEDIRPFMQSLDVFVLPSRWEGFGYVLVEAMASGVPVVGFPVGSIPEVIDDGKTGLVAKEKTPQALAESIEKLYLNSSFRKQLADAGPAYVQTNFSQESAVSKLTSFLANIK